MLTGCSQISSANFIADFLSGAGSSSGGAYSECLVTTKVKIIQEIEKGPIPATFIGMYIHKRPESYSCMYFFLDSFRRQYVADKTANNAIVVWRTYYLQFVFRRIGCEWG